MSEKWKELKKSKGHLTGAPWKSGLIVILYKKFISAINKIHIFKKFTIKINKTDL